MLPLIYTNCTICTFTLRQSGDYCKAQQQLHCVNQVTTVRLSSSFTIKATLNSYSKSPCPFARALLLTNTHIEQCSLLYRQIIPFAHLHCVNQVTTVRLSSSFTIKTTLNSYSKSPCPFARALLLTNTHIEQCSLLHRQIVPFAHLHCVNQVTTVRLSSSFTIKTTLNSYSKSPCPFARVLLLTNTHIEQCSLLYRQIVPFAQLHCVNQVTTVRLGSSFTIKATLPSYSKSPGPFARSLLLTNTHIEQCSNCTICTFTLCQSGGDCKAQQQFYNQNHTT